MILTAIDKALAIIHGHPAADFAGPRQEALIAAAEAALDIPFPPSYRRFLLALGCGTIAGLEIYGVISDNFESSAIPDGVWLTLEDRRQWDLPENLILIAETGEGRYYALNCETLQDGEAPVVEWQYGSQELPEVAASFGEWLLGALQERLGKRAE